LTGWFMQPSAGAVMSTIRAQPGTVAAMSASVANGRQRDVVS
jgi:hypothetical protein